jgi:DNA-binding HxlR family transcriptional regulator
MDMARRKSWDCPVGAALSVIGGRWKILIIYHLYEGVSRFNELRRALDGISQRVLARQLRELERDSVVARKVYDQSPPRVEYALTDFGRTLEPVMGQLCEWGEAFEQRLGLPSSGCDTQENGPAPSREPAKA